MSGWRIEGRFDVPANAEVLAFLRRAQPSAHSDVADELSSSARFLRGVRTWCPDPARYAFVVLHVEDGTILAVAWGQAALAYRLPPARLDEARADGGLATGVPELGEEWTRFEPWRSGETLEATRARLARWCGVAAEHALEGTGRSERPG